MIIEVYTDGSSLIDKKFYEASSAAAIFINDELVWMGGMYHVNGTNSIGEAYAMSMALFKLRDIMIRNNITCPLIKVYGDSDYVIKSLTSYIKTWVKQGVDSEWISYSSKKPVMHQEIFRPIYKEFLVKGNKYKIKFFHINSHIPKSSIKKARFSYMKRNEIEISEEEFLKHVKRNEMVDAFAEEVRINKTQYTETVNNSRCIKSDMLTRCGKIVIRKRYTK